MGTAAAVVLEQAIIRGALAAQTGYTHKNKHRTRPLHYLDDKEMESCINSPKHSINPIKKKFGITSGQYYK
nr:hypothetical protein [Desulforamulus aquiferis]